MAGSKAYYFSHTTTTAGYEVIATVTVAGLPGVKNLIAVTTNDLLFKFEYTPDGYTWYTSIEDYPIAAAASASLTAVRNALYYRVSAKAAGGIGAPGSCTWQLISSSIIVDPAFRSAFAYESMTVSNAHAEKFTVATMDGATRANVTVEDNPVRIRWDGTDPTTSEGHLMQAGDAMSLDFTADLWHFRVIATGADAKIRITYSR
jgi:hypothetical protein